MKIRYLIAMAFALLITNCELEKPVSLDVNYKGDRLVVYGLLHPKGVEVQLTHTTNPLTPKAENTVENATVSLYKGDIKLFDLVNITGNIFQSPHNFIPEENTEYHIVANAAGFETVLSETQRLPQKVMIENISIEKSELTYTFTDPADTENYYRENYNAFFEGKAEHNYSLFPGGFGTFSDIDFNGKQVLRKWESIPLSHHTIINDEYITIHADSVRVKLFSISKDLHLHLTTLFDHEGSHSDPLIDNPPIIYTNIKNGFGIFGSFSVDSLTFTNHKIGN